MTNLTFNYNAPQQPTGTRFSKPTPKMLGYYMDLCQQRKVLPKNTAVMSGDELSNEIEQLRKFYPASDKQKGIIRDLVARLEEFGVKPAFPITEEYLNTLTGGQNGTASKLIGVMMEKERSFGDVAAPSESQIEFIASMYLYPDANFEDYNIPLRFELDGEVNGVKLWRRPTPSEFAELIKQNMKRKEASQFIDMHRGGFSKWRQTRIRPGQVTYIRELEARLSNTYVPKEVHFAFTFEGEIIEQAPTTSARDKQSPNGYEPMDEMALLMLSVEDATKHIDQLRYELEAKDLYAFGEGAMSNATDRNGLFEQRDNSFTFESIRTAQNEHQWKTMEFNNLNNLLYSLQAMAGVEVYEFQNEAAQMFFETDVSHQQVDALKDKIREFMMSSVSTGLIERGQLFAMCAESEIAQEILLGL